MPGFLDQLRARFPEFKEYSDAQLVEAAAPIFGGSIAEAAKHFGVERNEPGFKSSFKSALGSSVYGLGRIAEDTGFEGVGGRMRRYGEDVAFRNPQSINTFEDFGESPWQGFKEFTGSAIGSTAPSLVPYAGPVQRFLGPVGTLAAGAATAAVPSYGQIRQTQDQTGQQDIPMAAAGALATGLIEQAGGVQRALRPTTGRVLANGLPTDLLKEMSSTPLRTFARQTLKVAGEESLEELAQNPIQQFAGGQNPMENAQLKDTAFSGFAGLVGSLGMGGVSGARRAMQQRGAQDFVAGNLTNPESSPNARLDAAEMQHQFMGGGQEADAWKQNMHVGIQQDADRSRAAALASGASLNLLDMQRDVNLGNPLGQPSTASPQGTIFDTINQNQGAMVGMPHQAPAQQPGTPTEPPGHRAASIFGAHHGNTLDPNSQEAQDYAWATQELQKHMSPKVFGAFAQQLAMDKATHKARSQPGRTAPKPGQSLANPNAAPQAASGGNAAATLQPGVTPAAAAPKTFGQIFKGFGGRYTNLVKALDQAKTPEDVVRLTREGIEKPNIASSTLKALEELHKHLTGKTYEQHLREQEAPNAGQSGSSPNVPTGNGQPQGAQPNASVSGQPAQAPSAQAQGVERAGVPAAAVKREVSDSSKRAQLAQRVISELKPEDQEILGFLQQHGEKAFQRLADKWGIARQAARDRVMGKRDREGNLVIDQRSGAPRQIGIVDKISNIVARHGLSMDDLLAAYKPKVYESDAARTGLSPKLNESKFEEESLAGEEARVEQGSGTAESAGGSQSEWKETARDKELAEQVPGYKEKLAAEKSPVEESDQQHIPAAQGEKVDERIDGREESTAEYAAGQKWWDTERDNAPHVPGFEDLSDRHQEEVIDAVKANEADGRLQKRITAEFNEPSYFNRSRAIESSDGFTEEQFKHQGIQSSLKALKDNGLFRVLDWAKRVFVAKTPLEDARTLGLFQGYADGKFDVILSPVQFDGKTDWRDVQQNLLHELSHGIDLILGISTRPQFHFDAVMMQELRALVARGTALGHYMAYPLDEQQHADLYENHAADDRVPAEVFAQLQAAWLTSAGRAIIQREAPRSASFLRDINEEARAFFAKSGSDEATGARSAQGEPAGRGQVDRVLRHRAFHGTPHNVHEAGGFTTQKIGSGEGAQAYGWGLYFAGKKAVAEWYRQKLSEPHKAPGHLYEVELAPKEEEYLDWDKPMGEQSEQVKSRLFESRFGWNDHMRGVDLYFNLAKQLSKKNLWGIRGVSQPDQKAASKALLAAGIPGIKYLDQGSRTHGQGSHNFVVFDDKAVSIKSWENRGKSLDSFKDALKTMPDQELADTAEMLKQSRDQQRTPENTQRWLAALNEINARDKSRLFQDVKARYGDGNENPPTLQNRSKSLETLHMAQAEVTTRLGDFWAKAKPTILTLHQIVDQFGDKMKGLKSYVLSMDKMEQRHQEILNRAHSVIMDWQKLPQRVREQLDQVMYRATLRGVHPDEPFGTGPNDHLTDRGEYDSVKAKFDALPVEAKATYKAVRQLLDANWAARKAAFKRSTTAAYDKLITEAAGDQKRVTSLEKERDKLIGDHERSIADLKGPYFPLLRIGDYLTIAQSKELAALQDELENATGSERTALQKRVDAMKRQAEHYAVEAHENRFDAEAAVGQYTARGMTARAQLAEQHLKTLQPIAAGAIDRISSTISDQFDKDTAAKMKRLVTELYISSLPEHAALQRQLKRKGIEGATQDMLRAVAKNVEKDAFYLARLEYADELASNLFQLKQEAKKAGIDYQHVYNDLAKRMALDFEWKPTPIQSALARLSGIWHLGMSPAYLLTNMTQPWMITAPVLAGRFGSGRAFSALRAAWVDAAGIISASKKGDGFADLKFDSVKDPQEREMLERIVQRGQVDITQNVDMGLVADGTDPKFLKAQKVFNWANQQIEASNRLTSALAGYRLARQRGMNHDAAAEFAFKVVVDTQLDYSNANAAYWMKSGAVPLGKLIFQFRKYQQGMLYLMARNAQLAFKGDKDAQRTLAYLAAMHLAFAGAAGIPVVTAPLAAVGLFMGGGDDEKGDAETQLRNYLADMVGKDAARALWKGLPTLAGLDISQRVGMGDFWKPLPYLRLTGKTGADSMGQLLVQTLGAPFGTLSSFWDGAKYFGRGDWGKGVEKMLPKMLADPLKASRYAGEGMTSRSGTQMVRPENIDGWDIAFRAAGFSPVVESEHYTAQAAKESTAQAIKERRDALLAHYANTRMRGGDTGDTLEDINAFNQDHPTQGVRIDRSAMIRAVQNRRQGAGATDEAGVHFTRQQRSLRDIDRFARP